MAYWGDYRAGQMVDIPFPSQGLDASSITLATNGTLRVYKNNSTTQRTSLAGVTFLEDFGGITGWHQVRIDLADNTDPGFYASGNDFSIGVVGAVVDGKTINTPLGSWSVENRSALRPTTAGQTIDVAADGSVTATGGLTEAGIAAAVWLNATRGLTDKLGFELSSAGIIAMWSAAVRELSASGNAAVGAAVSSALASAFSALTPAIMADAVWDELLAGHVVAGSAAAALSAIVAAIDPTPTATIRTAVWDKIIETQGSITAQQALDTILAIAAGTTGGGGLVFMTPNGGALRVLATVNANDERLTITLTPSA